MAKLSRQTKETIKTIVVVVAVIILVLLYIVYPLNRTKASMGRSDLETWEQDTMPVNDYGAYAGEDWALDTFRVEADGLTNLACLSVTSDSAARGLAVVIPSERETRDSVLPAVRELIGQRFTVVTYDQRASGRSTGRYHSDGQLEATDLQALISYLEIHGQMQHPFVVVGYAAGGDAALFTALEEKRIDALAAVNPHLSTDRLVSLLQDQYDMMWMPFYRSVFWWWYKLRSGYAISYREEGDISVPNRPAVVLLPEADADATVSAFRQAAPEQMSIRPVTVSEAELIEEVLGRISVQQP